MNPKVSSTGCFLGAALVSASLSSPSEATPPIAIFHPTSQWTGGCEFNITLQIPADHPPIAEGWSLHVVWPVGITAVNTWPLGVTQSGKTYTITGTSQGPSPTIAAGHAQVIGGAGGATWAETVVSCTLNSEACTIEYDDTPPPPTPRPINISGVDNLADSMAVNLTDSTTVTLSLVSGAAATSWEVASNNPAVCSVAVTGSTLTITPVSSGLAGLRIVESGSGDSRYIGVAVRKSSGALPGLPANFAIGSVSEDSPDVDQYWQAFGKGLTNRYTDVRYIYLNGGPCVSAPLPNPSACYSGGWISYSNTPGGRATSYIASSKQLGMIPCFVFYNVPAGNESFPTDSANLGDATYMAAYYQNLMFLLDICKAGTADGWPIMLIYEPDLLAYLMQNCISPSQAGWPATGNHPVQVASAYGTSPSYPTQPAALSIAAGDPQFPNTMAGFVQSVNYLTKRELPAAQFGWEIGLWAAPSGCGDAESGYVIPHPGNGLMRYTDGATTPAEFITKQQQIVAEATAMAQHWSAFGVTEYGATFVVTDKYGLDGGCTCNGAHDPGCTDPGADPSCSYWFWNADHWNNYLKFVGALHAVTNLPVILWQLPVGHVENTSEVPASGGAFPVLNNQACAGEDSAPTFFFGDTFNPSTPAREAWFTTNLSGDPSIVAGESGEVLWGSHISEAHANGAIMALFGAGVGSSTHNIPNSSCTDPPFATDGGWWMQKTQRYFEAPHGLGEPGPEPCPADVTGDGLVDASDLNQLLSAWGAPGTADLNGDGIVNPPDLAVMIAQWGHCH